MSRLSEIALAPDPALPYRDALLDERVVPRIAAHLGRAGHLEIDACERLRVNYRVGHDVRVLLRVRIRGEPFMIAARMFSEAKRPDVRPLGPDTFAAEGVMRPAAYDRQWNTAFSTFPYDLRIRDLPFVWNTPPALDHHRPQRTSTVRLAAYAPEKSATLVWLDTRGAPAMYAKVSHNGSAEREFRIATALWRALSTNTQRVTIPRPLAIWRRRHTTFVAAADGRRIARLTPHATAEHCRLGAAVATLHAVAPVPDVRLGRFDDENLRRAAETIASLRPDAERDALRLVDTLLADKPCASPPVFVHGDLHPNNVLVSGDHLTFLDFEDAAAAPPESDVASLMADLRYAARTAHAPAAECRALADAFLTGYSAVRPLPDSQTLRWFVAAAMLTERCLRAITRFQPDGLACLRPLIHDAHAILTGDAHD